MRAATLFVAVLCATLPAVHGRERLKTSENDPPRPDKDGTRTGKPEDPKPTEPTMQASSLCYGYQHRLLPPISGPRQVCAIVFKKKGDGGCEAVPELIVPKSKDHSSSGVKCQQSKDYLKARCYCGGRECNVDTEAISKALDKWIIPNKRNMPWLKNCLKALDQLGDDDPTSQLPVVTTEETSTTEDPDKVETEVKSTTVPPVETTTEMTTVSSEGATTTVATTTTTSTKEPETTTQTVSSDPATTSEASTTTETTTSSITTTTPETTTTTTTTTTTSETPTEEPETTTRTKPENEKDTNTTPGSGIPEAEATSGVETTIGQAGNGGSNDNQGSLGAEGSVNEGNKEDKTGGGPPTWLIILLVIVALLVISLLIGSFIVYTKKKEAKPEDIEGGEKAAAAAPPAPTVPLQPAAVVKVAPLVRQAVQRKNAPLPPKQPTLREQIMKEQWEQQLKLNAALDAAKKAPAVPAVPEVVPPKKEEEKAPVGGQVQVVDEQLPVLPTQEDNSLKEAPKVEAVKVETSWKEKATQGTVDSVKTQASDSHKSEKKKSSPPKELPKNDV